MREDAFAFDEIEACLRGLKQGRPVDIPCYDFITSSRLPQSVHVERADVVMVSPCAGCLPCRVWLQQALAVMRQGAPLRFERMRGAV